MNPSGRQRGERRWRPHGWSSSRELARLLPIVRGYPTAARRCSTKFLNRAGSFETTSWPMACFKTVCRQRSCRTAEESGGVQGKWLMTECHWIKLPGSRIVLFCTPIAV